MDHSLPFSIIFATGIFLCVLKAHFVGLAGSIGITLLIVASALPAYNNWLPITVIIFYIFSLIPTFMSRRLASNSFQGGSNSCQEISIFITTGIVISAFALPMVLARAGKIASGAAYLTLGGNLVIFATIFVFFVLAEQEDGLYPPGF